MPGLNVKHVNVVENNLLLKTSSSPSGEIIGAISIPESSGFFVSGWLVGPDNQPLTKKPEDSGVEIVIGGKSNATKRD